MRVATVCAAMIAMASSVQAANLDTDGYAMDSVTTYCQGMSTATGVFPNLQPNSANRCPVLVNLTPAATTVHKNEALEIKFAAAAKFGDIPGNIFPNAITDQTAKKVQQVNDAFMKACKGGTNCATVVAGVPLGGDAAGQFDANGRRALPSFRFNFAETGDWIVYGLVTLPGDPQLDVSGMQFITFEKITVVDTGAPIAPSPSPTPRADPSTAPSSSPPAANATATPPATNSSTNLGFDSLKNDTKSSGSTSAEAGTVSSGLGKVISPSTDVPTEDTNTNTSPAEEEGFFASHGVLLGAVAGICVVVLVIGYAVAMRRKNKNVQNSKLNRAQTQTFRMSGGDQMDDPEPVAYIRKKSSRAGSQPAITEHHGSIKHQSNNTHSNINSVPILAGTSTSSSDDMPLDISKRGSEMQPSFDELDASYVEGTVNASNKAVPTKTRRTTQQASPPSQQPRPSSEVAADSTKMMLSSLYSDRDTAVFNGKKANKAPRQSEQERQFYQSETWSPSATAQPYPRDVSTISADEPHGGGFGAPSMASSNDGLDQDYDLGRMSRFNSEASVDSYAFRPSNASVASYQSRVSRYSLTDSEMDRESSRISGLSLYSDRGTNV